MPVPGMGTQSKFRPFYAIFDDGLDRMFEVVKSEEFRFFVNGESLNITLSEAILILPRVHAALRLDRNCRILACFLNLFALTIVLPCQRTKSYHLYQFVDF
jgi:hypothetical protein